MTDTLTTGAPRKVITSAGRDRAAGARLRQLARQLERSNRSAREAKQSLASLMAEAPRP